jgi:hypothetical protein
LKPPLLLARANDLADMKWKAHYPVTYMQFKTLQRVVGLSKFY